MRQYFQKAGDGLREVGSDLAQRVRDVRTEFSENPIQYAKETLSELARDYWDLALSLSGVLIASKFGDNLVIKYFGNENYIPIKDGAGVLMWGLGMVAPLILKFKSKSYSVWGVRALRNGIAGHATFMFLNATEYDHLISGATTGIAAIFGEMTIRSLKKYQNENSNSPQGLEKMVQ